MMKLYPLLLVLVTVSGCMRAAAKTTSDAPPLDMPVLPLREVEPTEPEALQPVPFVSELARNAPSRARPTLRESASPRNEAPKPAEPSKVEPPAVLEAPKPSEEPARPLSTLQTTPATAEGEVERGIRASLQRANTDLNRIDYRMLNADAKTQYDTAKRFIRQADDAMRAKNFLFAKTVADKAALIAAQLGGK